MNASRRRWLIAAFCALLAHLALLLGARLDLPLAANAVASTPPLQLVFVDDRPTETPPQYVEQAANSANEVPESPEFLSNVDAHAADRELGAGDNAAIQRGAAEHPSVEMHAGSPGEPQSLRSTADAIGELVRTTPPAEPGVKAEAAPMPGAGDEMFEQPEAERLGSGVELFGDVRLSTVAWDFAPWLQRFRAALIRNWQAPYAFHLGLIHGQQRIRVEVGRDGALLGLTLLSNEGHESLQSASLAAFRAAAPYAPLPDHFPDQRLVMHWTLIYPEPRR